MLPDVAAMGNKWATNLGLADESSEEAEEGSASRPVQVRSRAAQGRCHGLRQAQYWARNPRGAPVAPIALGNTFRPYEVTAPVPRR